MENDNCISIGDGYDFPFPCKAGGGKNDELNEQEQPDSQAAAEHGARHFKALIV
jgi:hypothetical protein